MQRVKIVFDRNQDSITEHYLVYRAMGQEEPVLAYIVMQPPEVHPLEVANDRLQRANDVYYASHGNIIEDRQITVYINGQQVLPAAVNYRDGCITLDPVPPLDSVVTASYWFDGIELLDSAQPQEGVTRMAPPAVDRMPPLPVQNLRLGLDQETGLVRLEFDLPPATSGTRYKYHIVAADRAGNRSWPSQTAEIVLNQSLGEMPFLIQRSLDGGATWENAGETAELFFLDNPIFSGEMNVVTQLTAEVLPASAEGPGRVLLTWMAPEPGEGVTAAYRVITRSALDAYSDPSTTIGPEAIDRIAVRYLVRRSEEGQQETELGETTECRFEDSTAEAYKSYTYSVVAVDALENLSAPASIGVETGSLSGK